MSQPALPLQLGRGHRQREWAGQSHLVCPTHQMMSLMPRPLPLPCVSVRRREELPVERYLPGTSSLLSEGQWSPDASPALTSSSSLFRSDFSGGNPSGSAQNGRPVTSPVGVSWPRGRSGSASWLTRGSGVARRALRWSWHDRRNR